MNIMLLAKFKRFCPANYWHKLGLTLCEVLHDPFELLPGLHRGRPPAFVGAPRILGVAITQSALVEIAQARRCGAVVGARLDHNKIPLR